MDQPSDTPMKLLKEPLLHFLIVGGILSVSLTLI
jgi:hypothetical protein